MNNIAIIKGGKPGKTVVILGGVHGNEICGVKTIKDLQKNLKIDNGTVYLILGNPKAIKKNIRFIDMNLNRAFASKEKLSQKQLQSYERKRAEELMPYLEKCDASLDIHSSGTPDSPPFIICAKKTYPMVKSFPFKIVSSGWDSVEPGATEEFVDKHGGNGICIECGSNKNESAVHIAKKTTRIFLINMGLIEADKPEQTCEKQELIRVFDIHITKNNFTPNKNFGDFEKIKKGTVIGIDGNTTIKAPKDCYILFCRKRDNKNEEAFLLGKNNS